MTLRIVNIYRDAPLSALTGKIEAGPAKGLYTTEKHLTQYKEVYETLLAYCQSEDLPDPAAKDDEPVSTEGMAASREEEAGVGLNTIFISKLLPWGYLCTDLRVGAPTTWRTELGSERLREYYELNPDRIPELVLVLNDEYGTYDTCGDVEADPNPNAKELPEGFLTEYMKENNYETQETACGILYRKPR